MLAETKVSSNFAKALGAAFHVQIADGVILFALAVCLLHGYNPKIILIRIAEKAWMGTSRSVETVSESEVRCEADTRRRLKILPEL